MDDCIIRSANENDKADILKLLNEVFSDQQRSSILRGDDIWNWKYNQNPFGKSQLTVAEYHNEIIGVDNLWPWELTYLGNVIKAMQPCDSSVSEQFRGEGIFKKMRLFGIELAKKKNVSLLFNFPNNNSLPGNLSLGSTYMGKIHWWVKILKPIRLLKGKFKDVKSEPFDIGEAYSIHPELLDEIVNNSNSKSDGIEINRIAGFHNWRYKNRPNRMYGMVYENYKNNHNAIVFTVNQKGNNREMVIVDLLGSPEFNINTFKKINKTAKDLNVDFIAVMDNQRFKTNELWKLGFIKKKLKNMVVLSIDNHLEPIVTSFSNWSLMASMHDSI